MVAIPSLALLSGESGSGKTTLCLQTAALARQRGLSVGGLITLPRFAGDSKATMDAQDVRTGEERLLGRYVDATDDPFIQHWQFVSDGIAWGERVLRQATPCDVLIVDELGPLELIHGKGWCYALSLLHRRQHRLALVTVRPLLLPGLCTLLEAMQPVTQVVTKQNREALLARIGQWIEDLHSAL